jgi:hypothetical protein
MSHVPNANVIIDHGAGRLSTPDEHLERGERAPSS